MKVQGFFLLVGICDQLFSGQLSEAQNLFRRFLFPWISGPEPVPALRQPTAGDRFDFRINKRHDLSSRLEGLETNDIYSEISKKHVRDVRFFLYPDHVHWNHSEEIRSWDLPSLEASQYNKTLPLILLIHGFLGDDDTYNRENEVLKNAYLSVKFPANIIGVDYGQLVNRLSRDPESQVSQILYYYDVEDAVPMATPLIADLIIFLTQEKFLKGPENVQLIGFSLGGQLAAQVSMDVKRRLGRRIYRVTGLDPAGLMYYRRGEDERLSPDDAEFVDVTHTNQGAFGYLGAAGHVDFFINGGGPTQPGCRFNVQSSIRERCPHHRAFYYYADSIRETKYFGCACDANLCQKSASENCKDILFGQYVNTKKRGGFFVEILKDPLSLL